MQRHFAHKKLVSIVVCYKTDLIKFKNIVQKHINNFHHVILVNNSPEIPLDWFSTPKISIIKNQGNMGLSHALNVGISEAKKGFGSVALFDQDTELPQISPNRCCTTLIAIKATTRRLSIPQSFITT